MKESPSITGTINIIYFSLVTTEADIWLMTLE